MFPNTQLALHTYELLVLSLNTSHVSGDVLEAR